MSTKEYFIANINDLQNGEMKAIKAGEDKEILLCKIENEFYATGANCPHYGAPLAEGILSGDRIICPWHHSCFNAKTGDLLEPPAFDSLAKFQVKLDGDKVYVLLPDDFKGTRTPQMAKPDDTKDKRNFVIIGSGAASYSAAQALREDGYCGYIIMVSSDNRTPYDRPNLSKAYLSGEAPEEWMPLRPDEFYKEYGIELRLEKTVTSIDFDNKKISIENSPQIFYDKLLITTGGTPRKLKVPGSELKNIFYLRSFTSTDEIIDTVKESKNIVVIGSSFIGMESAISIKERTDINITVISPDEVPFKKIFGEEIGILFLKIHEEHGINFKLKTSVVRLEGEENVNTVILENGEKLDADMVIVGIGVKPATDFINNLSLEKDGSIKVDENFSVNEDVYAAGDIALFPYWLTGNYTRIEHWRTAEQQGRTAAHAMAGKPHPFAGVPFFWTKQGDLELKYVGNTKEWDEIKVKGDISSKDFVAYYIKDKKVLAAAGTRDKEMAEIHEKMRKGN